MKIILATIIFILFFSLDSFARENSLCGPKVQSEDAIFSLFAVVKNDILGSLPQFCRKDGGIALSEQMDEGEASLTQFVDKLKDYKISGDDVLGVDLANESRVSEIIFDTTKLIILKKMWHKSSENDQIKLLLSPECGRIGLNRFSVINESNKNQKDSEVAVDKTVLLCKSTSFKEIAPYISKDVLAETLLNLKKLFPKSFNYFLSSYCGELAELDELIFKTDEYLDYSTSERMIENSKEFSDWLTSVYKNFDHDEELTAEVQKKVIGSYYDESLKAFKVAQKNLEEIYLKAQTPGVPEHEVKDPYSGMILYKNSKGKYFYKKSKEMIAKEEADKKQYADSTSTGIASYYQEQVLNEEKKLARIYQENINRLQNGIVPYPDFPGFFIGVNKEGKHFLKIENKEELLDMMKKYDEKVENFKKKQLLKPENQKFLEDSYKVQMISVDEDNPTSTYIVKDENGIYNYSYYQNPFLGNDDSEKYYKKIFDGEEIGPLPVKYEVQEKLYQDKNKQPSEIIFKGNIYRLNELVKDGPSEADLEKKFLVSNVADGKSSFANTSERFEKDILNENLVRSIVQTYQKRTSDTSKLEELSAEEASDLRSYTGSAFVSLNNCLRANNCKDYQTDQIKNIEGALNKLKRPDQENDKKLQILFRGASNIPKEIEDSLNASPQSYVLDKGFMSTSGDINIASSFAGGNPLRSSGSGKLFIIKAKSCVGISVLSNFKNEDEFLCPPGMKFNVKTSSDMRNVYVLEEVKN